MDSKNIKQVENNPYSRKWKTLEVLLKKKVSLNEFARFVESIYFKKTNKKVLFTPFYKNGSLSIKYHSDGWFEEPKGYRKNGLEQTIDLWMEPKNMVKWKTIKFTKKNMQRLSNKRNLFRLYGQYKCTGNISELEKTGEDIGDKLFTKRYILNLNEGYGDEFKELAIAINELAIEKLF